jgi:hypothetical protein
MFMTAVWMYLLFEVGLIIVRFLPRAYIDNIYSSEENSIYSLTTAGCIR